MQSIAKNERLEKIASIKIKLKSILYTVRKNPFFLAKKGNRLPLIYQY